MPGGFKREQANAAAGSPDAFWAMRSRIARFRSPQGLPHRHREAQAVRIVRAIPRKTILSEMLVHGVDSVLHMERVLPLGGKILVAEIKKQRSDQCAVEGVASWDTAFGGNSERRRCFWRLVC